MTSRQGVILVHSVANFFWRKRFYRVAKVLSHIGRILFACYIGPGAKLGKGIRLGYGGLGIVIHGDAVIGDDVQIGTGVTLGGTSKRPEVPKVGDRCVIGAGAKILGGVIVDDESVIGANAVVLSNVRARSVVAGIPAKMIREGISIKNYNDLLG